MPEIDPCEQKTPLPISSAHEGAHTIEFQLRQELREYAVKVRQLAYTLPNGAGEHALLQMSEQMTITADQLALSRPGESEDEDWVC